MLRQILATYRTYGVMVGVERRIREMFAIAEEIFSSSSLALLEQKDVEFDLYARDREINLRVVEIRKKVVEHLSISPEHNASGELVFLKVITDIERVGDYSKNLLDLANLIPEPLAESRYLERFVILRSMVEEFFAMSERALFEGSEADAKAVIDGHLAVKQTYREILRELMVDKDLNVPEGIACALTARYLKRISAHLKNVASTAVSPYSHIGYMQTPEVAKQGND